MLNYNGNPESQREPVRPWRAKPTSLNPGSVATLRLRIPRRPTPQGRSVRLFYPRRSESQASDAAGLRRPDARQRPMTVGTPAPCVYCTGQARLGVARERLLPSAPQEPIGPLATPAGAGGLAGPRGPNPRQHPVVNVRTPAPPPPCTWGTRPGVARERLLSPCPQEIGPLATPAGAGRGKPTGLACLPRVGSGRGRRSGD